MTKDPFAGLESCVHCGFCLQSCPTYRESLTEGDSPRGRIVLLRGISEGVVSTGEERLAAHLNRCLGCRACEPVCPSGVEYGRALEAARAKLAEHTPPPLIARLLNATMGNSLVRRPFLFAARLARPVARMFAGKSSLGFLFGMLAATRPWSLGGRQVEPGLTDAVDNAPQNPPRERSRSVTVFEGCVMSGLFSHVHAATRRTLEVNGYELTDISGQECCGALHAHAGQHDKALELARKNVLAFAEFPDTLIAVDSAGCGAMLKDYGDLLEGDPLHEAAIDVSSRVRDVSELLADRGPRSGSAVKLRVVYDPPCHLKHAQGISDPPLALLDAVPGLEYVQHGDGDMCCGSAGSYSFTQSELSRAVLGRKIDSLLSSSPDIVATGNPGCVMQIGAGLLAEGSSIAAVHPVEILDMAYARAGYYD